MKRPILALTLAVAAIAAGDGDGLTALQRAVYREDVAAAKKLLAAGADANEANRYGIQALTLACQNGNLDLVNLLLDAGADPNTIAPGGETAMMTAARTGRPGPVKALLARGANVNGAEPRQKQTATMWAAAEGHAEVIKILIEAGADFKAKLSSGLTPMLFAVRGAHREAVKVFLDAGVPVDEPVRPLGSASGKRLPRSGYTALNLAIENGHFEMAAWLLDQGASPEGGKVGYTPLHQISWVRKTPIGDDHDPAPDGLGSMTSIQLVRKLAAAGANVNARVTKNIPDLSRLKNTGANPFFMASRTADVELMQTLIELGADPLMTNEDGATALMAAAGLGCRSPGEDPGTPGESLAAVELTLKLGNDINAVDASGDTAMHGAAYKNLPRVVEFLAAHGADINIWNRRNKQGWTPLTIAEGRRFGNFKPSPDTIAALHKVMLAAGVKPVSDLGATSAEEYAAPAKTAPQPK
jgi:ankyrin repeat protein